MLTNEQIQEFKNIYFKEYGIELNPEEAVQKAVGLFNLFKQFSEINNKSNIDTLSLR